MGGNTTTCSCTILVINKGYHHSKYEKYVLLIGWNQTNVSDTTTPPFNGSITRIIGSYHIQTLPKFRISSVETRHFYLDILMDANQNEIDKYEVYYFDSLFDFKFDIHPITEDEENSLINPIEFNLDKGFYCYDESYNTTDSDINNLFV